MSFLINKLLVYTVFFLVGTIVLYTNNNDDDTNRIMKTLTRLGLKLFGPPSSFKPYNCEGFDLKPLRRTSISTYHCKIPRVLMASLLKLRSVAVRTSTLLPKNIQSGVFCSNHHRFMSRYRPHRFICLSLC